MAVPTRSGSPRARAGAIKRGQAAVPVRIPAIRHPAQMVVAGFAGAIGVGTILLLLPIAKGGEGGATALEALFTATSAVCVTGLIVAPRRHPGTVARRAGRTRKSESMATHQQVRLPSGDHYLRLHSEHVRKVKLDDPKQCRPLEEWGHDVGRNKLAGIGEPARGRDSVRAEETRRNMALPGSVAAERARVRPSGVGLSEG